MNPKSFDRRKFLGAGVGSLAVPFLPSLLPRAARAQGITIPKRILIIGHEYGHYLPQFYPEPAAPERFADDVFYKKLTELPGPISTVLGPRFDPFRSRMNVYRGLDQTTGAGHNTCVALCAASAPKEDGNIPPKYGQSIDTLLQNSLAIYKQTPQVRSVRVGGLKWSWDRGSDGIGIRVPYFNNDVALYDYLFGGAITDPTAAKLETQQRTLIVGRLREHLKALAAHPRLGALDKQRLERHASSIKELERAVEPSTRPGGGQCTFAKQVAYGSTYPLEAQYQNFADSIVTAFSCDLTRVAVMTIFDFTADKKRSRADFHGTSHSREKTTQALPRTESAAFSTWISDRVANVLEKLDAVVEADGTKLLDNTLVLWATELSQGDDHRGECLPVVTIGNARNPALKTGYYLDYRQKPLFYYANRHDFPPMGRSYTQLLVTVMRTMGLQPGEYMSAGDGGGFGMFDDTHAYQSGHYKPYRLHRNSPLPFIFT
jgi:hypothetical protein